MDSGWNDLDDLLDALDGESEPQGQITPQRESGGEYGPHRKGTPRALADPCSKCRSPVMIQTVYDQEGDELRCPRCDPVKKTFVKAKWAIVILDGRVWRRAIEHLNGTSIDIVDDPESDDAAAAENRRFLPGGSIVTNDERHSKLSLDEQWEEGLKGVGLIT